MVNFGAVREITGSQLTPIFMKDREVIVPVTMSVEMHAQISQFAEQFDVPLESFLVMSALESGKMRAAIDKGYEIIGRNQNKDEIDYTEILYGDGEQFTYVESTRPELKVVKPEDGVTSHESPNIFDEIGAVQVTPKTPTSLSEYRSRK